MLRFEEIRAAAKQHHNKALNAENKEEAYNLHLQAETELQNIPEDDRTPDDWRRISLYLNDAGLACQDPQQELICYKQAINNLLNHIPETSRTADGWQDLAVYQHNVGMIIENPQDKLKWYKEAIESISYISKNNRKPANWHNLANYQKHAARNCKQLGEWDEAKDYYFSALRSLTEAIDNPLIANIYKHLKNMELFINRKLYSFAKGAFSDKDFDKVENKFLRLYQEILISPISKTNTSRTALLLFMQLLESAINTPDFPNKDVKKWLSDEATLAQFKKLFQELKQAEDLLFNTISQTPNFSVAVAYKLSELQNRVVVLEEENQQLKNEEISELQNRVEMLEKENRQLKQVLSTEPNNSYFRASFTLFTSQNQEQNKKDDEEDNLINGVLKYEKS